MTKTIDQLELKLMKLFQRSEEFGRVFATNASKEEFADAINDGALDHQKAAHEAMKLIKSEIETLIEQAKPERKRKTSSTEFTTWDRKTLIVKTFENETDPGYNKALDDYQTNLKELLK